LTASAAPGPAATRDRPTGGLGVARELPLLVAVAVVVAVLVKSFVAQAFYIPSGSMLPQLQINDRVVVSKLAYDLHAPRRGDIVVFLAPPSQQPVQANQSEPTIVRWLRDAGEAIGVVTPSTEDYIKRVIGLPGDVVQARGGHVYVDGRLLVEPYLPKGVVTADFGPVVVPPDRLWVLGDNRGDSCDSRCFPEGAIPESSVIGRAVFRVWPVGDISFL
jgi:signal peptidase I